MRSLQNLSATHTSAPLPQALLFNPVSLTQTWKNKQATTNHKSSQVRSLPWLHSHPTGTCPSDLLPREQGAGLAWRAQPSEYSVPVPGHPPSRADCPMDSGLAHWSALAHTHTHTHTASSCCFMGGGPWLSGFLPGGDFHAVVSASVTTVNLCHPVGQEETPLRRTPNTALENVCYPLHHPGPMVKDNVKI